MSKEFPTECERLTREERKAKDAERRLEAEQALRQPSSRVEAKYKHLEQLRVKIERPPKRVAKR